MNPHFLFNTLNTIAVLVRDDDRQGAVRIVEQLGDVLRRTLRRRHRTNEVPLSEELDLVQQYLGIEQARFSDRLHPTFDIDARALTAAVPSFALQHLVENAIRHGIARRADAGRVHVTARRVQDALELSVHDDGPGIEQHATFEEGHGRREHAGASARVVWRPRVAGRRAVAAGRTIATLRVPFRELKPESGPCGRMRSGWGALIADDEPAARRGVRQLLAAFPEFVVVGECRTGADVLASLDTLEPAVVFLDVQMPGMDGFEVIRRRTPERMPAVVFLTAYDDFAIKAFEAQALDYLVKPVSEARFAATMKRLTRQLRAPRRGRARSGSS